MSNNVIENMIVSVRFQMKALDQMLAVLQDKLDQSKTQGNSEPVCPICGSAVSDISTMGCAKPVYCCTQCDYRGEIC